LAAKGNRFCVGLTQKLAASTTQGFYSEGNGLTIGPSRTNTNENYKNLWGANPNIYLAKFLDGGMWSQQAQPFIPEVNQNAQALLKIGYIQLKSVGDKTWMDWQLELEGQSTVFGVMYNKLYSKAMVAAVNFDCISAMNSMDASMLHPGSITITYVHATNDLKQTQIG